MTLRSAKNGTAEKLKNRLKPAWIRGFRETAKNSSSKTLFMERFQFAPMDNWTAHRSSLWTAAFAVLQLPTCGLTPYRGQPCRLPTLRLPPKPVFKNSAGKPETRLPPLKNKLLCSLNPVLMPLAACGEASTMQARR